MVLVSRIVLIQVLYQWSYSCASVSNQSSISSHAWGNQNVHHQGAHTGRLLKRLRCFCLNCRTANAERRLQSQPALIAHRASALAKIMDPCALYVAVRHNSIVVGFEITPHALPQFIWCTVTAWHLLSGIHLWHSFHSDRNLVGYNTWQTRMVFVDSILCCMHACNFEWKQSKT